MSKNRLTPSALVRKAHKLAASFQGRAHAPYSKYNVGAAIITDNKKIVGGCNIENVSYGGTVCAERVAIWKAVSEGQKKFTDVIVVTKGARPAPPCAFCLQVMAEFCAPSTRIWVGSAKALTGLFTFGELLTHPFTPDFL
jgi:cytidine deaminase